MEPVLTIAIQDSEKELKETEASATTPA